MSKVERAIAWMVNTANDSRHGYDQKYRWGEKGDYDCSSAMITAWEYAGVPVKSNGATYTGNMYSVFKKCGFKDVTGSKLKRGDVLLTPGKHTALYIGNGQIVNVSINEKGKTRGGKPGDQTGKEFCIRSYYNYPWKYVLRYEEPEAVINHGNTNFVNSSAKPKEEIAREVIRGLWGNGSDRINRLKNAGYNPSEIQSLVNSMLRH